MKSNHVRGFELKYLAVMSVLLCVAILAPRGPARSAWTPPTSTPPNDNVDAPLNTSSAAQTKQGNLTLGGDFLEMSLGSIYMANPDVVASPGIFWADGVITTKPHINFLATKLYISAGGTNGNQIELKGRVTITNANGNGPGLTIDNISDCASLKTTSAGKLECDAPAAATNKWTQNGDNLFPANFNSKVGIGDETPDSPLTVGANDAFMVDIQGNIIKIKGVTYSWPGANPGAGNVRYLKSLGIGNLTWDTIVAGASTWEAGVANNIHPTTPGAMQVTVGWDGAINDDTQLSVKNNSDDAAIFAKQTNIGWSSMGTGPGGDSQGITTFNGNLYVGSRGYGWVSQWNGANWSTVGIPNGTVNDLTVYNNQLYVASAMTTISNCTINCTGIARWTGGTNWVSLSTGLRRDEYIEGLGYAMISYNGRLYVGGDFYLAGGVNASHIAYWDGSNWFPGGNNVDGFGRNLGANSIVSSFAVYGGNLVAGGYFTSIDGVAASRIARFNGTNWLPLGAGIAEAGSIEVGAMTVFGSDLIVGGDFTTAGGVAVNNVARWNGTTWSAMGSGIPGGVSGLTVYNNQLYATGGPYNDNVKHWNGSSWETVSGGVNSSANGIGTYNNKLIVIGGFSQAGGATAKNAAAWSPDPNGYAGYFSGKSVFMTGNVGVGTANPSPTVKLEVRGGAIKATDGLVIQTVPADPAVTVNGQMWLIQ